MILPKEVLERLRIAEGDSLSVSEGRQDSVQVSISHTEVTRHMEPVQDVMKRYHHTLSELAK